MNAVTLSTEFAKPLDGSRPSIFRRAVSTTVAFVFGRLLPRVAYPVLRGPLRGCRYILGATAGPAGGASVHFGVQEVEQLDWLTKLLSPGAVFFDVGANVGLYSLLASRLVGDDGRVFAFEPLPRNLTFLHQHMQLNRATNVAILPLACADRAGTELFCEGANNALGHLGSNNTNAETSSMRVDTTTLDDAARRFGITPDVIKIDVEGAELRVLCGAIRLLSDKRPSILLSIHSAELGENCLNFLSQQRYSAMALNSGETEFVALPDERAQILSNE